MHPYFPLSSCSSLTDLHRKGVALPDPEEILGNLDKPGEDPDGAPCLRETDAHADFLFRFAKTVIVCSTFKDSCNVILLSGYMSISLEAYAVLTYANSYDTWMEEATRRKEGRNEEDSTSPSSAGSKKRRFTEKTRGTGKIKGWVKSGIKLYNKINKLNILQRQRTDESLVDFEPTLKTWFLKGKNLSHSSPNDEEEDDSDREEDACNNFILKGRAMEAVGQQVFQL